MRKLAAADRPKVLHHAEVSGRKSDFPFDMLRYDGAYPTSGDDAFKLYPSPSWHTPSKEERLETVTLNLSSFYGFTPARWESFGWRCRETNN